MYVDECTLNDIMYKVHVSHLWCHENKKNGTKISNANYTEMAFSEYVSASINTFINWVI